MAQLKALGVAEFRRYARLLNGVAIIATPSQAQGVAALPGVRSVHRSRQLDLHTAASVPFIGAPNVWGGWAGSGGADGTSVRIGIIDTGIDYTHADFAGSGNPADYTSNDRTIIEPGTFPTAKVVGGYDFVGDAYTGGTNAVPDPDPMDCAGHGSHVAGIAAGLGVLTNGATWSGPYTNGMDFAQFKIGPGVAPRALLYALKVFGCSGSTRDVFELQALEWAADPNDDGDFSDRLDVVNLSLGSWFGQTGPGLPVQDALNQLADLGCVPVLSAGNSYDTFYIVGYPSTAEKALCVAACIDDGPRTLSTQVLAPASIVTNMGAIEGALAIPLVQNGPVQAPLIYAQPNTACSPIANSLAGSIALIDRGGGCSFADKILRAQSAGAMAVIMVNNVSGAPLTMTGASTGITIPAVMISLSDGALLKAHLNEGVSIRLAVVKNPALADQISDFSSRGPAAPASSLKPEIGAPGYNIDSVQVGGGTRSARLSGTSMASPQVAGAAGLLRQLHPDWSTEEIKAALMNTARPTFDAAHNPYPESRTGAGRIEVDDAARVVVTAKAENSGGLVSLCFGALTLTNTWVDTRNIVLSNHSATAVSYSVAVSNTVTENGVTLTSALATITVPANGSALAPVTLSANPWLFDRTADLTTTNLIGGRPRHFLYEASGEIWFQNTNLSIHVPYYANLRAGSDLRVGITNLVLPLSLTGNPFTFNLPVNGSSTHPQPIVSAFQLGSVSSNAALGPLQAPADLLAVGAACDAAVEPNFNSSFIYFAVATAGDWASPTPVITEFDFQIDTNFDGTPDVTVFNNSLGNNGAYSDVFMSDIGSFVYSYINGFSAAELDSAPFNNNVLVIPISVLRLSLSGSNTRFQYRVATGGYLGYVETTPWITFDAAAPVLDTVGGGIGLPARPIFNDNNGGSITIKANPNNAPANGLSSPNHAGLMLLHHFNQAGRRLELVDVQFAPQLLAPQIQGNNLVLKWTSAANAVYTVQYATNLNEGFLFTAASGIAATPPQNTLAVPNGAEPARFYRLKQQ